ncbi:MAG: hypothetical protein Q8L29_04225 [archaeon]|nr:hypothetical protein [archaeon]
MILSILLVAVLLVGCSGKKADVAIDAKQPAAPAQDAADATSIDKDMASLDAATADDTAGIDSALDDMDKDLANL